jgi:hypothetical protein
MRLLIITPLAILFSICYSSPNQPLGVAGVSRRDLAIPCSNAQPDPTWMNVDFDDSGWQTGFGGFGFADGDDGTIVPQTTSVYFRQSFSLADLSIITNMIFNMDYDDGFVAYLNGVEIARENAGANGSIVAFDAELPIGHEAVMYQGDYQTRICWKINLDCYRQEQMFLQLKFTTTLLFRAICPAFPICISV